MNKILVEVSVGELLDKISILEIKKEKIKDSDKLIFINDEYLVLTKQLDENITLKDELKKLYEELKAINAKLWDIEDNKRMCEKNSDFGVNFIKFTPKSLFFSHILLLSSISQSFAFIAFNSS